MSAHHTPEEIRKGLTHPVVDGDGFGPRQPGPRALNRPHRRLFADRAAERRAHDRTASQAPASRRCSAAPGSYQRSPASSRKSQAWPAYSSTKP